MITRAISATLFAVSCFAVEAADAAPLPTAASISASISAEGPKRTIDDLVAHDTGNYVSDQMDKGGSAWIALAPRLAPGSDAGSAEDLGLSLAFALPKNPAAVLSAIDPNNGAVLGTDRVCGMPFIEDTVKDRSAYRRGALAAVAAVKGAALAGRRTACLKVLTAAI